MSVDPYRRSAGGPPPAQNVRVTLNTQHTTGAPAPTEQKGNDAPRIQDDGKQGPPIVNADARRLLEAQQRARLPVTVTPDALRQQQDSRRRPPAEREPVGSGRSSTGSGPAFDAVNFGFGRPPTLNVPPPPSRGPVISTTARIAPPPMPSGNQPAALHIAPGKQPEREPVGKKQ